MRYAIPNRPRMRVEHGLGLLLFPQPVPNPSPSPVAAPSPCLQAGLRSEYDACYFTQEARQWAASVKATPGAEVVASVTDGVSPGGRRQFGGA